MNTGRSTAAQGSTGNCDRKPPMIFDYIKVIYNRTRIHISQGYLSPEAFEAKRAHQPQEAI